MSGKTVTTQSATGLVQGKFNTVSFNVVVNGRSGTGPGAKAEITEVVERLHTAIQSLKASGVTFEEDEDRSTLEVSKEQRYDNESGRHVFSGYLAEYTLEVKSTNVDRVSEIQDALTSVEGAEVDSPVFHQTPESRRELQKVAVRQAWEVIKQRLKEECEVLELDINRLEVESWNANYGMARTPSYSNSATRAFAADMECAGGGGPIEVKSGLADVQVTLTVSYRWKHEHR